MSRAAPAVLLLGLAACATVAPAPPAARVAEAEAPGGPGAAAGAGAAAASPAGSWRSEGPPPSLPAVPRTVPRTATRVLPGGLKVVVVEHRARPQLLVRLLFASGAAADAGDKAGTTYFALSGLMGASEEKGTLGQPLHPFEKTNRTQVRNLGAHLGFEAGDDQASLRIDGFSRDLEPYLRQLSQVVREPHHGEDSLVAQLAQVEDLLDELEVTDGPAMEQFLGRLAFGEGHPYARPVFGTPASLAHLGIEDLVARQEALLVPAGSTLLVVGDVDAEVVFRQAALAFAGWRRAGRALPARVPPPAVRVRSGLTFVPRKPARTTLVCGVRPLSDVGAQEPVLEVLSRVVGARLEAVLREEHTLTYGVSTSLLRLGGAQALLACSRLDAGRTTEALRAFLGTLTGVAARPPAAAEVERAQAVLVAENDALADDFRALAVLHARAIVLGGEVSLPARAAALRAVAPAQVQALGRQVVRPELFQVVVSGERARVQAAAAALKLGALRTPQLSHREE